MGAENETKAAGDAPVVESATEFAATVIKECAPSDRAVDGWVDLVERVAAHVTARDAAQAAARTAALPANEWEAVVRIADALKDAEDETRYVSMHYTHRNALDRTIAEVIGGAIARGQADFMRGVDEALHDVLDRVTAAKDARSLLVARFYERLAEARRPLPESAPAPVAAEPSAKRIVGPTYDPPSAVAPSTLGDLLYARVQLCAVSAGLHGPVADSERGVSLAQIATLDAVIVRRIAALAAEGASDGR